MFQFFSFEDFQNLIITDIKYSKSSDVYAFGMLIYEIFVPKKPFDQFDSDQIIQKLKQSIRPDLNYSIPDFYRRLIEKCWSQDPIKRPTFDEITHEMKSNSEFITDKIDIIEYQKYMKFIEDEPSSFNDRKPFQQLTEEIKLPKKFYHEEIDWPLNSDFIINIDDFFV